MTTAAALPTTRAGLIRAFGEAGPVHLDLLVGTHEASFCGPALLRRVGPAGVALGGLPRWYGKRFRVSGDPHVLAGINLLRDGAGLREKLPMTAAVQASWLDGGPVLAVSYAKDAPPPWRWVRDEFRPVGDGRLLGLTFVVSPRLRALAAPFVLDRR